MDISTKQWVLGIIGLAVLVALSLGAERYFGTTSAPASAPTTSVASTTAPAGIAATPTAPAATPTQSAVAVGPFPINAADHIASWTFTGAYAGNDTLTNQANTDVAHLTGLLGIGQYDDYDLYDGIANDFTSLGNGKTAYDDYNRAIAIHPKKGLAYTNLAHLFDGMGALYTAADAYAKATAVEPAQLENHIQRLRFLTSKLPNDNAAILAALTDANKQFGDTASILSIEAEWLTGQKRYADAITAWQTVASLSPGSDHTSIDAEIVRLKAKE